MTSSVEGTVPSRRVGKSSARRAKRRRKRLTIGYLAHRVGDNVSQAIWTGVVDAAREQDVNLICFAGDRLRDPDGRPSPEQCRL